MVYREAIAGFYDLYDDSVHLGTLLLPRRRLVVLDGPLRLDQTLLGEVATVEELPWMQERGFVAAAIGENPAQIAAPRASQVALFTFGLGPAPTLEIPTVPFSHDPADED